MKEKTLHLLHGAVLTYFSWHEKITDSVSDVSRSSSRLLSHQCGLALRSLPSRCLTPSSPSESDHVSQSGERDWFNVYNSLFFLRAQTGVLFSESLHSKEKAVCSAVSTPGLTQKEQ